MEPTIRQASNDDILAMHQIRLAVRENRLSNPTQISLQDYRSFIAAEAAWVAELEGRIVGFAAVNAADATVWALFVAPVDEGSGVGRALHSTFTSWAAQRGFDALELLTGSATRAEGFYLRMGWQWVALEPDGQVRFRKQLKP